MLELVSHSDEFSGLTINDHPNPTSAERRNALIQDPAFGTVFTDHMATIRWHRDMGWHDAQVSARAPFQIDPACSVLHYAQEIFEGMKAYRTADGGVALFRPEQNARRFAQSAARMAMPELPEELFLSAVETLVERERDWIPEGEGSLYLRPFMFASETFLGVRPSNEYIFCVIASPAGAYFKGGAKPITLWVSEDYSRAAPGGTGAAKCGGNYAASLLAQSEAYRRDCDQVVFLDAVERRWIEELGGMNLFFVMNDKTMVTPQLGGSILPGITRNSIITLARDCGIAVHERRYSLQEWRQDAESGRVVEAFACGTAAVLAGIREVRSAAGDFIIGNGGTGSLTKALRDELVGMQRGLIPDRHGWLNVLAGTAGRATC